MKRVYFSREEKIKKTCQAETVERIRPTTTESCRLITGSAEYLQQLLGNSVLQRLAAQCNDNSPFDLDNDITACINRERSSGQALDAPLQKQAAEAMGHNLSSVHVHTSPEADALNRQLDAKAFTTGQDIFFRSGAYDPHSSNGQELIAHELTHVVQQSTGAVSGGSGKMTVNAPGDAFEQEADAVAKAVVSAGPTASADAGVQRQALREEEEEEELAQRQLNEEEEEEELP